MRRGCSRNRLASGRSSSRTERAKSPEVVMGRSHGGDEGPIPQKRNRDSPTDFEIPVDEPSLRQSFSGDDQGRASDPSFDTPQVRLKETLACLNGSRPPTCWRSRVDQTEHWQSDLADAAAHLATAHELIDGLLGRGISSLPIRTCSDLHEAARFAIRAVQALDAVSLRTWVGMAAPPKRQGHTSSLCQVDSPVRQIGRFRN
jgi:hypothetical protein